VSGSNPLSEHKIYMEIYGEEQADWLMDEQYRNYKSLVFAAYNQEDLEKYRLQAEEVTNSASDGKSTMGKSSVQKNTPGA
jgi:hypothetical protein